MADEEVVGRAVIELRAENAKLRKDLEDARAGIASAMSKVERDQARASKAIQAQLDKINAVGPTKQIERLAAAVEKAGGVSALSANQLSRVTAEVNRLAAAGAKVPQTLAGLTGSTSKIGAAFQALGSGGGISGALAAIGPAGLAAAAGLGAITVAGSKAFEAVSGLAAQAERWTNIAASTGLGTTQVQQLTSLLEDAGIPAEALGTAFKELQKEIATGGKELAKFGIDVAELKNLSPEEQFRAMASQIAAIEDPATRTAAALAAFGRSGQDLIPVLDDVAKGSDKMLEALSEAQVKALAEADAKIDAAARKWEFLKKTFLATAIEISSFTPIQGTASIFGGGGKGGAKAPAPGPADGGRDSSGDLAFWKEQERQMAVERATEEAAAKDRKAQAKSEAADREKLVAERLRAIQKENAAQAALIKDRERELALIREATKALLEKSFAAEDKARAPEVGALGSPKAADQALFEASVRNARKLFGDLTKAGVDSSKAFEQVRSRLEGVGLEAQDIDAVLTNLPPKVDKTTTATVDWGQRLAEIAHLAQGLPGIFGEVAFAVAGIGSAIQGLRAAGVKSFGDLSKSMKTFEGKMAVGSAVGQGLGAISGLAGGQNTRGGRALAGAATGAQIGALGGAPGMVIGAVVGGLVGLFKKPAWEKAAKDAAKILGHDVPKEMAEAILAEAKASGKSVKEVAAKIKRDEQKAAAEEKRQNLEQGLSQFQAGLEGAVSALADLEKSPALEQALADIGAKLDLELGKAGLFRTPDALKESKGFQAAQAGAGGIATALSGARQAGVVDAGLLQAAGTVASELQKKAAEEAVAAGLTQEQAQKAGFGAVAQLLREQLNAQLQSTGRVDAALQAQLAEAKANGIEILADPAIESLAVQRQQLDVLQQGFGVVADSVATATSGGAPGQPAGVVTPPASEGFIDTTLRPVLEKLETGIARFDPAAAAASRFGAAPEGEGIASGLEELSGAVREARPITVTSAPQLSINVDGSADQRTIDAAVDAIQGLLRKRDAEMDALISQAADRAV